jgi:hypothetical protein
MSTWPRAVVSKAPGVVGKSIEEVPPVTNASPLEPRATPKA